MLGVAGWQLRPQAPVVHASTPVVVPEMGAGHMVPQAPQLSTSPPSFTHVPEHSVKVSEQVTAQLPIEHTAVPLGSVGQTVPHMPQWEGSLPRSTQASPHLVKPAAHVVSHVPALHVTVPFAGAVHAAPQPPQLARSLCSSTQAPPQALKPVLHTDPQLVPEPEPEHVAVA